MKRQHLVLVAIALLIPLSGCVAPSGPEWGDGQGTVKVTTIDTNHTVETWLGTTNHTYVIQQHGCEGPDLIEGSTAPISVEGWMSASAIYDDHSALDRDDLTNAVAASAAVNLMSFESAGFIETGIRVEPTNWDDPLRPETGNGEGDLDGEPEGAWAIIGVIPATEEVAQGITILDSWHQPIRIEGFVLDGSISSTNPADATLMGCRLSGSVAGGTPVQKLVMVVTSVTVDGSSIGSAAVDGDRYVLGDVPIVGRTGYIIALIVVGLGGGAGLFVASTALNMRDARRTARLLLGEDNFEAAMASDRAAEEARQEERARTAEPDYISTAAPAKPAPEPKKSTPEPEPEPSALSAFSLDDVLGSPSESTSPFSKASGPSGGGVVASAPLPSSSPASSSPQSTSPATTSVPSRTSGPPQSRSAPPTSSAESIPPRSDPPVRRRTVRATRNDPTPPQPAPAPEPEPERSAPRSEPEEDFSDFSI